MSGTRSPVPVSAALVVLAVLGAGCAPGEVDVSADGSGAPRVSGRSPDGRARVRPVVWSPHANTPGCHINLGPTGARGWLDGAFIRVAYVATGSPADDLLRPGDVIVGVNGARLTDESDSRMEIGRAITASETEERRGRLTFVVKRDGAETEATVRLPVTGSYSATWPFDCRKSRRILGDLCRYLEHVQMPNGRFPSDGELANPMAGLVFLASGELRYLERARRTAYWLMEQDLPELDLNSWIMGYSGVFLAEYYLRTGDRNVIENLGTITKTLAEGQMLCGSWGHNCPGGAYGAMNQAGIVCTMALILARECGVGVDRTALTKALRFFDRYVGRGSIPYGDHLPWGSPSANGKNASGAVMYSLLDDRADAVAFFSGLVAEGYRRREQGHTGPLFCIMWGPLGAVHAAPEKFRTFMDYQTWYYDLCRTWRGALTISPYAEALTRFDNCPYVWWGGSFTSGVGLTYAMPLKKLRILGAPGSVFGAKLGKSGATLKEALGHYGRRRWRDFDEAIAKCKEAFPKGSVQARWTAQLEAAADEQRRSVDRTLAEIENHLAEDDHYRAELQYDALGRYLGRGYYKLNPLRDRFEEGGVKYRVGEGKKYYDALAELQVAAFKSWVPRYGHAAKGVLDEMRLPGPSPLWKDLVALPGKSPAGKAREGEASPWKVLVTSGEGARSAPAGWQSAGFDDSAWKAFKGRPERPKGGEADAGGWTVLLRARFDIDGRRRRRVRVLVSSDRYARTDVYLNGTLVTKVVLGKKRTAAKIELDRAGVGPLRQGTNCLAVSCSMAGERPPNVGAGLQAGDD